MMKEKINKVERAIQAGDGDAIGGNRRVEGRRLPGGTRFMMTGTVEGGELKIEFSTVLSRCRKRKRVIWGLDAGGDVTPSNT